MAGGVPAVYRVDHVVDGDTIALRNGQRVRLVQIDTPEVFFGAECYGRAASLQTKRLLPTGTRVRLFAEPATDRVDQYGRLLRYVVRVKGALNVNIRPVAVGAAAPYFYRGRRGDTRACLRSSPSERRRESSACGAPARTRDTTPTRASKRGPSDQHGYSFFPREKGAGWPGGWRTL
jgi:endonuclease YncB( thermonuclease family)